MKIETYRSKFTIFVFQNSVDDSSEIKQSLNTAGYDSYLFVDQNLLLDRVKQAAPHVIVFSPEVLQTSLSEFVEQVLTVNSEVQFICVAPLSLSKTLLQYREFGFSHIVAAGPELPSRVLWAVDSTCESLILTYQNEQLLKKNIETENEVQQSKNEVLELQNLKKSWTPRSLVNDLKAYHMATSKDDLVAIFFQELSRKLAIKNKKMKALFFKFLPSLQSFVATQGYEIDIDRMKGLGIKLKSEELLNLSEENDSISEVQSLKELMKDGLKIENYIAVPIYLYRHPDSLLVIWGQNSTIDLSDIQEEFSLFSLVTQNFHWKKRAESLEVIDTTTDLFNRSFYEQRLAEEVARARRLQKAVSLVKISIDNYVELAQSVGDANRDLILRSIAQLIKKTSRVNDYACRTDDNEISMILPHCARKGAALRAERLRKAIEVHSFTTTALKITVSLGVSEYPSLSSNATQLDGAALEALKFISEKGNKVCLYRPADEFKPDFEVPPL